MDKDFTAEYTIDHDKIGKKGYPIHYQAHAAPPPLKKVERKQENINPDPNK